MSLKIAAQHLASHGRDGDSTLVHMSPGEVRGLQHLAMAHGGSLSTNPHTGLPEASYLSALLPMIGGAALTAMTGLPAWQIGLGAGALGAAASGGDMQKGLMAGLGAYGGAGLMGGLIGAGAAPAVEAASTAAGPINSAEAGFAGNQALASAQASPFTTAGQGISGLTSEAGRNAFMQNIGGASGLMKYGAAAAAPLMTEAMTPKATEAPKPDSDPGPKQYYSAGRVGPTPTPDVNNYQNMGRDTGREQTYFNPRYSLSPFPQTVTQPVFAAGGPVEQMSNQNAVGANTGFPTADINHAAYATPYQQPISQNVLTGPQDTRVDPYTGEEKFARGGLSNLGGYSDGGHLLRGPGDGVSDSIPAMIGKKQPARLADGEFVVPARIVSELGNGSTEAGARKLYAMMDRVQAARSETVGKGKVAKNSRADQHLPA